MESSYAGPQTQMGPRSKSDTSMNRQSDLTQEKFDGLLEWLDSDRDRAGDRYEYIRRRLIKIFTCRGRHDAEELADETISRVIAKVLTLSKEYVGDPALYFYGVAQKVYLEAVRKRPPAVIPPPVVQSEDIEEEYECLERCMGQLTPANRELVLEYYQNDKKAKIENRKELAHRKGIAQNALRIRAYRIRSEIQSDISHI
jgi:DNA-directed RNA polymerase specialized sigma24 family protein